MSRPPAAAAPPPVRASSGGVERVVALALAVMIAALAYVYLERRAAATPPPPLSFDFENPLLKAMPGECVEMASADDPHAAWFIVRAPGVVKRPYATDVKIAGWSNLRWPDPKGFLPYLLCVVRPAVASKGGPPASGPPIRDESYVFPLNGFGMDLSAMGVLQDISPVTIEWGGQRRKAYAVGIQRYGAVDGPWILYIAPDVPVLGTMMRTYLRGPGQQQRWIFRIPDNCR